MENQHVLDQNSYKEKGDASKGTHNFQKLAQELDDSVTTMTACTVLISHGFLKLYFIIFLLYYIYYYIILYLLYNYIYFII